jgi:hypothetical protein
VGAERALVAVVILGGGRQYRIHRRAEDRTYMKSIPTTQCCLSNVGSVMGIGRRPTNTTDDYETKGHTKAVEMW